MRIDSNTNSFKNIYQNKSSTSLLSFVSVAVVTVSNGGDNLGIYTHYLQSTIPLTILSFLLLYL